MDKKVLLITGASSGFGFDVAEEMLRHKNYIVYVAARRLEKMKPLVEKGAIALKMDVSQEEDVQAGIAQILAEQGKIDALLANAGFGQYGSIEDVPLESIQYQFDVNVFGMARVFQAVLPTMREQGAGRIVMTNSMVSNLTMPSIGWYAASKHAMKAVGTTLRQEVRPFGIEVVMIEPGIVSTGFYDVALNEGQTPISQPYRPLIEKLFGVLQTSQKISSTSKSTVRDMVKALTVNKPRFVYRSTYDAKIFPIFLSILPQRLVDWVIYHILKS